MDRKLIDYEPEVVKEYEELQQILNAEQKVVENMWEACDRNIGESVLDSETVYGVSRWESILAINPKVADDIEIRKFRIKGKLNEDLPYTNRTLKRQLEALCGADGYRINLMNDSGITLLIRVALNKKELINEVESMADRIVPANIIVKIELMYNQHEELANYEHEELHDYTQLQLRESVLG